MKRKKILSLVLTFSLLMVSRGSIVDAATKSTVCPPHGPYVNYSEVVSHWSYSHRYYTGEYTGNIAHWYTCNVNCEAVRHHTYCSNCNTRIHSEDVTYESHSICR